MNEVTTGRRGCGKKKNRRIPRKVSETSLRNAALHYLQRFASSAENLRRVLMRRVWRSARHHDVDVEQAALWVDAIIRRYQETGLLDDAAYAAARVRSFRERGNSDAAIRARLRSKGLAPDVVETAMDAVARRDGAAEQQAAVRFARRRRLGPFAMASARAEEMGREKEDSEKRAKTERDRDLAAMARAGFGYDLARRVIDAGADDPILVSAETPDNR